MRLQRKIAVLTAIGLMVVFASGADAADIGLKGIGGRLGFVMPDEADNTIGFGAVAKLGSLSPIIGFDAFIDFWTNSYDIGIYEWKYTEIAFGAMAKYLFPAGGDIKPYAGGGLALHYGKISGESIDYLGQTYDTSDSDMDLGIHLAGGVEKALSPSMTGFAEAKYAIGGHDYFFISAGVIFKMGD